MTLRAALSARTLNPIKIALDAAANCASVSLIPPTPEETMRTLTRSVDSLSKP